MYWAFEGLAFLIELGAIAALGYWGFTTGRTRLTKILLGIGAPVLAGVVWGLFAAPEAAFEAPIPVILAVKALVFGAATLALHTAGRRTLAVMFAVVAMADTIVITIVRAGSP